MQVFRYKPALILVLCLAACQSPRPDAESEAALPVATAREMEAPADTTTALFEAVMDFARHENLHARPLGEIMMAVGEWFEGKPYVAGTLDEPAFEQLVVKLDGFDCVTFVESILALSRTIKDQSYSYQRFADVLRSQRYRGNQLNGYCSRLHYFSEWIADNEARGHVENITEAIGGVSLDKHLTFMSEHRSSYRHLASSDSLFEGIKIMEASLKGLPLFYIPQERIRDSYPMIQGGDILALATDIDGLDVSHTGMAYRFPDGRIGLLHASTSKGVTVSPDLQGYVENNKRQIGIVVARPR